MGNGMINDDLADLICKKPSSPPAPPVNTMDVYASGPASNDCNFNPTFCKYNKV